MHMKECDVRNEITRTVRNKKGDEVLQGNLFKFMNDQYGQKESKNYVTEIKTSERGEESPEGFELMSEMLNSPKKSEQTLTHIEKYNQGSLIRPVSSITNLQYSPTDDKRTYSPFMASNKEKRLLVSRKNLDTFKQLKQSIPSM